MARNGLIKRLTAILTLLGLVIAAVWALEVRFAKAADLDRHVQAHQAEATEFRLEVLENRRIALRRDIYEIELIAKQHPLTSEQARYLDQIREDYAIVVGKIKALQEKK